MATVRVPSALRRFTAGAAAVRVDAATVREALDAACAKHPDLRARLFAPDGNVFPYLLLFRNERPATLPDPLAPDDEVEIVAAVEGG